MKKNLYFFALSILIITLSGCLQNTQTVKSQPEPASVSNQTTPTQEEKPKNIDPPISTEPPKIADPNVQKTEIPVPIETKPKPEISKDTLLELNKKYAFVLNNFVNDEGKVSYSRLRPKRLELIEILSSLKDLDRKEYDKWPKEDKIAFWINAYNINLLKIIVDNYPIDSYRMFHVLPSWGPDSVRHIDKRVEGIKNQKFIIMEEEFTLEIIEQRLFRTEFDDPRIFLAVTYYATTGGPLLRNEPFTGKILETQLDEQTKKYISSQYGFNINTGEKTVYLSPLFDKNQFGNEFLKKYATDKKFKDHPPATRAVLNFLTNYLSPDQINYLETKRYTVKFIILNWNLNKQ
jgi:hypothetical protein